MNEKGNDVRSISNKELPEVLKDFIKQKETELTSTYYVGKVIDNNDPDKEGKCRIRVYGVYGDNIPDGDLPWALPEFGFIGSTIGSFIVPPNDCIVNVRFADGNIYEPIYTSKMVKQGKQPSDKNNSYPDTLIFFELDGGDKFTINRQTGETIYEQRAGIVITMSAAGAFKIDTRSGANIEIDTLGNVNVVQSATGTISLGGTKANIPCPDLVSCPVTGSPLAITTNIPGFGVKVP